VAYARLALHRAERGAKILLNGGIQFRRPIRALLAYPTAGKLRILNQPRAKPGKHHARPTPDVSVALSVSKRKKGELDSSPFFCSFAVVR
jgi:hypothetical protein